MNALETRIPPPLVFALAALAMWGLSFVAPALPLGESRLLVAAVLFVAGFVFSASGIVAFRLARTTVDPTRPEQASTLVRSGIYRITRNPMYVGLSLILTAWAVFLASLWAFAGPVAFMLYIRRFQIAPEERALAKRFGSEYDDYRSRVRRWL